MYAMSSLTAHDAPTAVDRRVLRPNVRFWVGYHFRHAAEVGLDHGRTVARLVTDRQLLQPVR
jgi:hypothetical protein